MRRLAALLTLALLAGCSTRARLNPFDPGNPVTGGRPTGFVAIAGNQSVRLAWNAATAPGLVGYEVFRQAPGDSVFRPLTGVLPPTTTSISDFGLRNGADHRYRLYFVFGGDVLGSRPAEDVATPGPLRPWVAEVSATALVRLSADGRRVAESVPLDAWTPPWGIDVDRRSGRVWVVGDGAVVAWEPSRASVVPVRKGDLGIDLESVAVDPPDSVSAWVADATLGRLWHLEPDGSTAPSPLLNGMKEPICVAVDAADRSIWVADQAGGEVRRYTSSGTLAARASVPGPNRLAVDPVTHDAWVTAPAVGRVVHLAADGTVLDSLTAFPTPVGIAVDPVHGRIWVTDFGRAQVVALDRSGAVLATAAGLSEPRRVAVDPTTGEAWVTLGASGSVVRLSPAGGRLATIGGFQNPWDIVLDDVTARAAGSPAAAGAGRLESAPPIPAWPLPGHPVPGARLHPR